MKTEAEKNKKNIFFLEYHVDYWNKLGWKDPYSSFQYTLRQKNYTSALKEESIYTPMMVVNGTTVFTGSDAQKANAAVSAALDLPASVELKIKIDSIAGDTAFIHYQSTKTDKNFFLRIGITEDNLVSKVTKGENSGKTLTHESVVRVFSSAEVKDGSAQVRVALKKVVPGKNCRLIAFIQHKQTMKIMAVTSTAF